MADNVAITAGAGTIVASDDVAGVQYQRVKITPGPDGTATVDVGGRTVDGGSTNSAMYVDPRVKAVRISVTPTVSTTPAYTAKDAVGAVMTFSNAVRASGGSCRLEAVQVVDKGQQMASLELMLYDRAPATTPTDNAIYAPTDAELVNVLAVVPIYPSDYSVLSTNSVASRLVGAELLLNGTDLFGILVTRGTPTYTSTTALIVSLTILQD